MTVRNRCLFAMGVILTAMVPDGRAETSRIAWRWEPVIGETSFDLSGRLFLTCGNIAMGKNNPIQSYIKLSGAWNPDSAMQVRVRGVALADNPSFLLGGRCNHPSYKIYDLFWRTVTGDLVHGRFVHLPGGDEDLFVRFEVVSHALKGSPAPISVSFHANPGIAYPDGVPHENRILTPTDSVLLYRGTVNDDGWPGGPDRAYHNHDVVLNPEHDHPLVGYRTRLLGFAGPHAAFSGVGIAWSSGELARVSSPPGWATINFHFDLKPECQAASFYLWSFTSLSPKRAHAELSVRLPRIERFLREPFWTHTDPDQILDHRAVKREMDLLVEMTLADDRLLDEALTLEAGDPDSRSKAGSLEWRREIKSLLETLGRLYGKDRVIADAASLYALYETKALLERHHRRLSEKVLDDLNQGKSPLFKIHEEP